LIHSKSDDRNSNGAVTSLSSSRDIYLARLFITFRNERPWSAKSSQSQFLVSARSRQWHGPRSWAGACTSCFIRGSRRCRHSALLASLGTALRQKDACQPAAHDASTIHEMSHQCTNDKSRRARKRRRVSRVPDQLLNAHSMPELIYDLYQARSGLE
jgi:hypothetical protein